MPTPAGICNLALLKMGEKQMIDALSDSSELAQVCNVLYEPMRNLVLEEFWWPFATRRADLAIAANSSGVALTHSVYDNVYALPADCLMPRYIETGLPNPAPDQQIPFTMEDYADTGRVLATSEDEAELVYTRLVTETGKFTPKFVDALAWRLAVELAAAIPVRRDIAEKLLQGYHYAVADAAASAFKHTTPPPPARPAAIRAR